MTTRETPIDDLLEHATFLRRLAVGLVHDEARADDLIQDTWLAALRRPPHDGAQARGWLAAVARRLSIDQRKTDARRSAREEASARVEAQPPSDELEERVELAHALLDLVRALDEPYREAIWLRYYESLPPRAIARRLGVPVKTVDTRLRRGKDELRARLDARGGRREAWLPAMAGLAASRAPALVALTSVASVPVLGAGLLTLILIAAVIWFAPTGARSGAARDSQPLSSSASAMSSEPDTQPSMALQPREASREPAAVAALVDTHAPEDRAVELVDDALILEGCVSWMGVEPEGDVRIGLVRDEGGAPSAGFLAETTCRAGVPFTLEIPDGGRVYLVAVAEGVPVSTTALSVPTVGRATIAVLEDDAGVALAGVMRDAVGEALAGARVTARRRGTRSISLVAGAVIGSASRIEFDFEPESSALRVPLEPSHRLGMFDLLFVDGAFRRAAEQVVCDAHGRFRFFGLGAGEHTIDAVPELRADAPRSRLLSVVHAARPLVVAAPDEGVELVWHERRLRLLVRDESGPLDWVIARYAPFAEFERSARAGAAPRKPGGSISLGIDGELTLLFDPADDLGVSFERGGHASTLLRLADVTPDADGVVIVDMPRTSVRADLHVRFDDRGNAPPKSVLASLKRHRSEDLRAAGGVQSREVAIVAGMARFENLPPGEYALEFKPRGGAPFLGVHRQVSIAAGTTSLEIMLESGGGIEIELEGGLEAHPGIGFLARDERGRHTALSPERASPPGAAARLSPALPPGVWTLIARDRGTAYWEGPLQFVAGEVARIAVPAPPKQAQ